MRELRLRTRASKRAQRGSGPETDILLSPDPLVIHQRIE